MTPQEARQQYPDAFASDEVYQVVAEAVAAGEATLYVENGVLMYRDPLFGAVCAVSSLRYRREYGLHRA